jgi:hypothetical protein
MTKLIVAFQNFANMPKNDYNVTKIVVDVIIIFKSCSYYSFLISVTALHSVNFK